MENLSDKNFSKEPSEAEQEKRYSKPLGDLFYTIPWTEEPESKDQISFLFD